MARSSVDPDGTLDATDLFIQSAIGLADMDANDFAASELAIVGIFLLDIISGVTQGEDNTFLPFGRSASFIFLLLLIPLVNYFSGSKSDIQDIVAKNGENELKEYYQKYVYTLLGSGALFILLILVFK